MQAHHPFRHLLTILRHFETFWGILNNFEQLWAVLSNFEQLWAILSNFFGPAWVIPCKFGSFSRGEQFWTVFGNTIRPWTVFKMSQLMLLWDILLWLKKVADVNPTDLDPKTRPVKTARFLVYDPFATWMCCYSNIKAGNLICSHSRGTSLATMLHCQGTDTIGKHKAAKQNYIIDAYLYWFNIWAKC